MDLNDKEDSGFGVIRNHTIMSRLESIKDTNIREQYLNSLKNEDNEKFEEFMSLYKLLKKAKDE